MENLNQPSRREFLGKLATSAFGLVAASEIVNISGLDVGHTAYAQPIDVLNRAKEAKRLIPVMLTPFGTNLKIDFDGVSRLTDFYLAAGAKGFFANCLSSEMYFMDDAERLALTRHVVKYVNDKVSVVSTGSFGSTMEKQAECTRQIHGTGVDAVILISSHFAKKEEDDDVLIRNFEKFFDLTGNIPLGTYECPSPYKRLITTKVFKALLNSNRLVYHKDTSEDINKIQANLELLRGSKLEFYNAHTATALPSMQLGGAGLSPVSANFYPEILAWLCENATNPKKKEDAIWIQAELKKMEPVISKAYPLSAKYFLIKRGMPMELSVRSKKQITPEGKVALDDAYKVFLSWCDRLSIKPVKI